MEGEKRQHSCQNHLSTNGRQCLIQIIDHVLRIFKTNADAQHVLCNVDLKPCSLSHAIMGGGSRMRHQGSAVANIIADVRSEEHTSELQSLMRISYAVFCLKK